MSTSDTVNTGYLQSLLAGIPHVPASPLAWLNTLRSEAVDRVGVLTVPTQRDEEWRFTDISQLNRMSFHPVRTTVDLQAQETGRFRIEEAASRLVFVDGVYASHLSTMDVDNGVSVVNLEAGLAANAAAVESCLGRHAEFRNDVFSALNTAFLQDTALVVVPQNVSVSAPVHLLFIATQKDVASYPRCLLLAGSGSVVTVIEDYVSLQEDAYFTNAVTEIVLAENARVNHIRVQREGMKAVHIANGAVSLARASNYQSVSVAFGARISRYNLNVRLAEEAECAVDGLALIAGRQLADTHTCIDHVKPHAMSHQLHKCIVGGGAHAVFNGKIMVRQGAQRTDSRQSSRNLLLTSRAHVDTKPQLEIFADDVKCTHGATIGQLDSEEVFYLQSRGLSETVARNMLTYAFGAEIIEHIPVPSLKSLLEQTVLDQTTVQP